MGEEIKSLNEAISEALRKNKILEDALYVPFEYDYECCCSWVEEENVQRDLGEKQRFRKYY